MVGKQWWKWCSSTWSVNLLYETLSALRCELDRTGRVFNLECPAQRSFNALWDELVADWRVLSGCSHGRWVLMHGECMSSCVPYRTEEEDRGRTAGGYREGKQVGRTGWRRRRLPGGLAWLYVGGNRRKKESLSGIRHSSLPIYQSLPFPLPRFSHHIWTHSIHFFPPFQHSFCFLSRLHMSSRPSSFSFIPFIVVYLSSAPSFHFCLFVCVLTIFSLLHLFTGKELGERSVPVQSRLCHPTERVGVKHRHWRSLQGRWHHIEANGSRATWIYVCCHPLIQGLIPSVHLNLRG